MLVPTGLGRQAEGWPGQRSTAKTSRTSLRTQEPVLSSCSCQAHADAVGQCYSCLRELIQRLRQLHFPAKGKEWGDLFCKAL